MAPDIAPATARRITGTDLRLRRVTRRVTVTAVARAAGVSRQRIGNVEATAHPTRAAIVAYLEALAVATAER